MSIGEVRMLTNLLCGLATGLNVVTWFINRRAGRVLKEVTKLNENVRANAPRMIYDAWRGGLEQAAHAVAALLQQSGKSGTDPATLLRAESAIHDIIRELNEKGETTDAKAS